VIVGSDTQIQYYEQSNSKDLIGIIQGVTNLDINQSYFQFVA